MFNGISIKLRDIPPQHETKWCFLSSIKLIGFISKKLREERNERGSIVSYSPNISSSKSAAFHFWADKVGTRFVQEAWTMVQMPLLFGLTLCQHLMENTNWWSIVQNNLKPYVNTSVDYKGMFSRAQYSKRLCWNTLAIIPKWHSFPGFQWKCQSVSWWTVRGLQSQISIVLVHARSE